MAGLKRADRALLRPAVAPRAEQDGEINFRLATGKKRNRAARKTCIEFGGTTSALKSELLWQKKNGAQCSQGREERGTRQNDRLVERNWVSDAHCVKKMAQGLARGGGSSAALGRCMEMA